jgi:ABC-type spermidine/putrescine transport system permease subunit I
MTAIIITAICCLVIGYAIGYWLHSRTRRK